MTPQHSIIFVTVLFIGVLLFKFSGFCSRKADEIKDDQVAKLLFALHTLSSVACMFCFLHELIIIAMILFPHTPKP